MNASSRIDTFRRLAGKRLQHADMILEEERKSFAMKLLLLPVTVFAVLGLGADAGAMAEHSMQRVYHHHYMRMHTGAHEGHRQPCIGRSSGTAHHSCGSHTGGPSGGLH